MVKSLLQPPFSMKPKKRFAWWRGLLGALLTFLIIVPYIMGGDVEKYIRQWLTAFNQNDSPLHAELQHYQRHWFTSEADILITGKLLQPQGLTLHVKAYHGPLFFNAGHALRLGLTYMEGNLDPSSILGSQEAVKFDGLVQLTAFVPYFSDRELHASLPTVTFTDKPNNIVYSLKTPQGNIDGDNSLQMELPSLTITRLNGDKLMNLNAGTLRILPRSHLASFSAKQIDIFRKDNNTTTISNVVLQGITAANSATVDNLQLDLSLHFDQLKGLLLTTTPPTAQPLEVGPFEFKLKASGLHTEGLNVVVDALKIVSLQQNDLTPDQGEKLEKAWASIFANSLYEMNSKLTTSNGQLSTQFHGGFKSNISLDPLKTTNDLSDSFYSQGSIQLSAEIKDLLSQYATQAHQQPRDPENLSSSNQQDFILATILGFLKPDGQGYATQVDIQQGKITVNGVGVEKH